MLAASDYAQDAANLAAYIALRRADLRRLQEKLSVLGLSSLGRCEGHVMATLDAVEQALDAICGVCPTDAALINPGRANRRGDKRLKQNTQRLLGKEPKQRRARIMVTLPTVAAGDMRFVQTMNAAWISHASTARMTMSPPGRR